jgi:hypothetical protein
LLPRCRPVLVQISSEEEMFAASTWQSGRRTYHLVCCAMARYCCVESIVVGELVSREKVNWLALKENICGRVLIGD